MRNRNNEIKVRLTDKELAALEAKVAKTRWTREAFIRAVLEGEDIYVLPDPITCELLDQIRRIGTNLNQLVFLAYSMKFVNVPELEKITDELWKCLRTIENAYVIRKKGKENSL